MSNTPPPQTSTLIPFTLNSNPSKARRRIGGSSVPRDWDNNPVSAIPHGPPKISGTERRALVYSNFIYLLPVFVLVYKYFGQKAISTSGFIILSVFYIAVMLYSINYHLCQKHVDPTPDDLIMKCASNNMFYSQAQFNDLTMANFALFITILYIIPIHTDLLVILQSIGILWMITTQSFTSVFNNVIYNSIPALVAGIFYSIYLVVSFKHHHWVSRVISIIGCLFSIAAVLLFLIFRGNYGLTHTLWHVFGGLAGGCLLFPAVIPADKFTWRGLLSFTRRDATLLDTKL